MYDREKLRAAAAERGDKNANRVAIRLGCCRSTAYALWNGTAEPSRPIARLATSAYDITEADLLVPAKSDGAAA